MTRDKMQSLYDSLGTVAAVAEHLGLSRSYAHFRMKRLGVVVKGRGGAHQRPNREAFRAQNKANGDCATYAKPATRALCSRPHLKKPRQCVLHDGYNDACKVCENSYNILTIIQSGFDNYYGSSDD